MSGEHYEAARQRIRSEALANSRFLTGSATPRGECFDRGFYPMFDSNLDAPHQLSSGASARYEFWSSDGRTATAKFDQRAIFRDCL